MSDDAWYMVMLLIIIGGGLLFLTGCSKYPSIEVYEAPNGDTCKNIQRMNCGVRLYECSSGYEYECLSNVKVILIT